MKRLMVNVFLCTFVISCFAFVPAGAFAADLSAGVPSIAQENTGTVGDDDDDDGGTGCAASYLLGEDDPRLEVLRSFRDDVLSKTATGAATVDLFYAQSDAAIEILEGSPAARLAARKVLESIIPAVELIVQ